LQIRFAITSTHIHILVFPPANFRPCVMFAPFMLPPNRESDGMSLDCPPVIRLSLVVQVPDTSNMRGVALSLRPVDRCSLCAKSAKHLVALGLDHIIIDRRPFRPSLWPSLYINICHYGAPLLSDLVWETGQRISYKRKSRRVERFCQREKEEQCP
jgi:hypothetical protein